ncbi:MAG: hypothetical protein WAQ22_02750 [Candidatus Saccharimonas sp.]
MAGASKSGTKNAKARKKFKHPKPPHGRGRKGANSAKGGKKS